MTRAKRRVIFFDRCMDKRGPMFSLLTAAAVAEELNETNMQAGRQGGSSWLAEASDNEGWARAGRKFLDKKVWEHAARSFNRSGDLDLELEATGMWLMEEAERMQCGDPIGRRRDGGEDGEGEEGGEGGKGGPGEGKQPQQPSGGDGGGGRERVVTEVDITLRYLDAALVFLKSNNCNLIVHAIRALDRGSMGGLAAALRLAM